MEALAHFEECTLQCLSRSDQIGHKRHMTCSVLIQDRSTMYRKSLGLLLGNVPEIRVSGVVADRDSLQEALDLPFTAVLFEAAEVPWNWQEMAAQIMSLNSTVTLVGTRRGSHQDHQATEGVTLVPRTASSKIFVRALQGQTLSVEESDPFPSPKITIFDKLSPRELQVLAFISSGITTDGIASRLGISGKTVENRRQSLFAKLSVQSQSQAVAVALRAGILGAGRVTRRES
jgi:DNA-binding CsgD family transcriptional regulator